MNCLNSNNEEEDPPSFDQHDQQPSSSFTDSNSQADNCESSDESAATADKESRLDDRISPPANQSDLRADSKDQTNYGEQLSEEKNGETDHSASDCKTAPDPLGHMGCPKEERDSNDPDHQTNRSDRASGEENESSRRDERDQHLVVEVAEASRTASATKEESIQNSETCQIDCNEMDQKESDKPNCDCKLVSEPDDELLKELLNLSALNAEKFRTLNGQKGESDDQKSERGESANSNGTAINDSEAEAGNEQTNSADTQADLPISERSNESADSNELSNSENGDIAQRSNRTNIASSTGSTSDTSASTADAALARCEQPIVNKIHRKIDIEIAVDELCKGAESSSLLLKKYNRTNNDPTDEEPSKLDRQPRDAERPASNFDDSHTNLNGELIAKSSPAKSSDLSSIGAREQQPKCESPFDLSSSLQSIGNLNLALALSGLSSLKAEDLYLPAKNDNLELARPASSPNGASRSKHHSEVIINYCEKIDSSSLISKRPKSRRSPCSASTEDGRPGKHGASGQIGQAKRPSIGPSTHPLDNSYNSVPFSAFTDPDRIKFVDIVKKVNLPTSSQSQAECIVLDEEDEENLTNDADDLDDREEELNANKFTNNEEASPSGRADDQQAAHHQAKQIRAELDHVDAVILSDEAKQTNQADCNRSVIARKFAENQSKDCKATDRRRSEDTNNQNSNQNQPKMSTLISPSNKLDMFDDLDANMPTTAAAAGQAGNKMDLPANKPLKGLLKKAKSSDSTGSSSSGKKKRRVKFAETMMVWWVPSDDWSDELMMPQMIALKSPSEFNLVEIAAQTGYMFEPPAEYKDLDFLPFDPPPDYRDCINSNTNPFVGNDLNFPNLPNHALLQMYENDGNPDSLGGNLLSKLDFDEDMFMKFNYAAGDHSEFCDVLKDAQLEDSEQLDAYKDMILNNSNEMLEEDDIIGVLKEDDILQAIGSQIDSLDKKDGGEPDAESGSKATREENSSEKENAGGQQNSIIILNKNGNCQPIQIITSSESSDISFSNMEDYPMSPNGSLQDLASDSSITSQDTIIMMTNAILTDKTNAQNHFLSQHHNVDLQTKRNRLRLCEPQNAAKEESSSSKDSGIITTDSDNQDSLKDSTRDEEMAPASSSREKNDENNNQDNEQMKSSNKTVCANGVPQLVQNFQKYSNSLAKQDAQLSNPTKIEKSAAVSVSELRESFERRMSVNSDKSDSSSSSIGNNQQTKDKVDSNNPIYQNIPINNGSFGDSESSMIVEYTSEPKVVLLPNKRTTSLQSQQQGYSPQSSGGKSQKVSSSQTDSQLNQQNAQNAHLHVQANLQQQSTSPQLQSKLISSNENKQLLISSQQAAAVLSQQTALNQHNLNLQQALNQQLTQQLVQQQQQQQTNSQAAAVQQAKLNQLNMMRTIPVQRMPNGNIYLSIDRRTLPHQIKMIPTQISQIRPPPYELSKTNANNQLQQQQQTAASTLKQPQAAIVPIPHIHLVTSAKVAADQQQQVGQQSANSQPSGGTVPAQSQQQTASNQSANKVAGQQPNENKPQFHYQTLPIRFTANAKQIRLQPNLAQMDAKCCPNQATTGIGAASANAQPQPGKPQLILIHSYPPNNLAGGQPATIGQLANIGQLGNQKAIAIKMIHHSADKTGANQTLTETTPALLTANGKIITTVAPNGTILNPNLMNSNAIIQQALLRGTLKDPSTSSFPNASEIRRRDGLNAFPYVWNPNDGAAKPGGAGHPSADQLNKAAKDELESFVRQDMQRTERIRKRYSVAEEENDEDPSFGFSRRPSIKSIKSKFGGSTEMIKQLQPQLSAPNKQPTANIIQLTTKASAVNANNLQGANSQIILASHQLKGPDMAKLTAGQPVKAIPIIQKTQNNQRHVYLIQNQLAQNAQLAGNFQQQQRLIHAGATLPRNTSSNLSAVNSAASAGLTPAGSNLSNPQTNPNNSRTVNTANPGQRPSSSLGDHKDNQQQAPPPPQQLTKANLNMNSINGLNLGDPSKPKQIMYYHNVVNCNKIAMAPNAANLGQVQQQQTGGGLADAGNPLQYKTISMPNVALIKTALISQQQQQQQQNQQSQILAASAGNPSHPASVEQLVKSGPQLITLVAANSKDPTAVLAQNASNPSNSTLVQKSSTITKQASSSSTSSINSSMSSSSLSTTAASSASSTSAPCNNQTPNNQTNNSNLVKEAASKDAEKVAKLKQVAANKDEMIFYQMNV